MCNKLSGVAMSYMSTGSKPTTGGGLGQEITSYRRSHCRVSCACLSLSRGSVGLDRHTAFYADVVLPSIQAETTAPAGKC
jgi:hypothetical protein